MTSKYDTQTMTNIWFERNKYMTWINVLNAVISSRGTVNKTQIPLPLDKDVQQILHIEDRIYKNTHEMIGLVIALEELFPQCAPVYYGLTSSDVMDTALSLNCKESDQEIVASLRSLLSWLDALAKEVSDVYVIGRTHGQWAEPMRFSSKLASWMWDIDRHIKAIESHAYYGKMSGPVGSYNVFPPDVELVACRKLGLDPAGASTQIIDRSVYAEYILRLSLVASTLDRIATEIRNLARPEIGEVSEVTDESGAGSSAMKHKSGKNPALCERVCSLSRVVKSNAIVAMDNISLWHERDLTNSANERIIFPESYNLTQYMIESMIKVISAIKVDESACQMHVVDAAGDDISRPKHASHMAACKLMINGHTYAEAREACSDSEFLSVPMEKFDVFWQDRINRSRRMVSDKED